MRDQLTRITLLLVRKCYPTWLHEAFPSLCRLYRSRPDLFTGQNPNISTIRRPSKITSMRLAEVMRVLMRIILVSALVNIFGFH